MKVQAAHYWDTSSNSDRNWAVEKIHISQDSTSHVIAGVGVARNSDFTFKKQGKWILILGRETDAGTPWPGCWPYTVFFMNDDNYFRKIDDVVGPVGVENYLYFYFRNWNTQTGIDGDLQTDLYSISSYRVRYWDSVTCTAGIDTLTNPSHPEVRLSHYTSNKCSSSSITGRYPARQKRAVSISRSDDAFMGVCDGSFFNGAFKNQHERSDSYLYRVSSTSSSTPTQPTLKVYGWYPKADDFTTTNPLTPPNTVIDHTKLVLTGPTLSYSTLDYYIGRPSNVWPLQKYIPHFAIPAGTPPHIVDA